ncbi:YceI family protein [Thermus sp. FJN-A]
MRARTLAVAVALGLAWGAGYQVSGEVRYEARAPLGAFGGTNPTLRGRVDFDPSLGRLEGRVCLDLAAWDSKEPLRDRHTREMFQVERFPEACLTLRGYDAAKGLVLGELELHGVRRAVSVPVSYRLEGQRLAFTGELEVRLGDFGLKAPSFMGMRVQDRVVVRVQGQGVAP